MGRRLHGVDYERGVVVSGPSACWSVGSGRRRCGRAWRSGLGSCCWPPTELGTNDIVDRVGVSRPTVTDVAEAVRRTRRDRGLDDIRRSPAGRGPSMRWPVAAGHAGAAAGAAGGDALVDPAAGRSSQDQQLHRLQGVAGGGGYKPWRRETFKFSTNPELEAKIRDVVGLYLNPPERPSYSASTRNPRFKPWTGPRRSCRYALDCRRRPLTTTCGTAPPPCSLPWRSPPAS